MLETIQSLIIVIGIPMLLFVIVILLTSNRSLSELDEKELEPIINQ